MQHKGLAAILVAGALTLMAGGAYAGSTVSFEGSSTESVAIPLPPSSPTTVAIEINGEREEFKRDGAKNQTLHVEIDGATSGQLNSVRSPDCQGFNVERHLSAKLGSSEGHITITREYTPVLPDGSTGKPQKETVVSYNAPDQPAKIGVDVCA